MGITGPCARLSWSELACHDRIRTPYPLDFRMDPTRLPALCDAFRAIRAECTREADLDCPLIVTSAYRTPEYQAQLLAHPTFRAARKSQHVEGRALDLALPRLLTWEQFVAAVKRATAYPASPIRYVEYRPFRGYIHIDVRQAARLVEELMP